MLRNSWQPSARLPAAGYNLVRGGRPLSWPGGRWTWEAGWACSRSGCACAGNVAAAVQRHQPLPTSCRALPAAWNLCRRSCKPSSRLCVARGAPGSPQRASLAASLLLPGRQASLPPSPLPPAQVYASKQAAAASPEATDPCERPPAPAAAGGAAALAPACHPLTCHLLTTLNARCTLPPTVHRLCVQQRDAFPLHQPLLPGRPAHGAAGVRADAQARVRHKERCRHALRMAHGSLGCLPLPGPPGQLPYHLR